MFKLDLGPLALESDTLVTALTGLAVAMMGRGSNEGSQHTCMFTLTNKNSL